MRPALSSNCPFEPNYKTTRNPNTLPTPTASIPTIDTPKPAAPFPESDPLGAGAGELLSAPPSPPFPEAVVVGKALRPPLP
jgi:hypothetical protein